MRNTSEIVCSAPGEASSPVSGSICAVLMPSELRDYATYRAYYFSRRRWLFGLLVLFSLMDFADTAMKHLLHRSEFDATFDVRHRKSLFSERLFVL